MKKLIDSLFLVLGVATLASPGFCHNATIRLEYDSAGRVEQMIHPNQKIETYTYNGLDSQETVSYGLVDVVTSTDFSPSGLVVGREISPAIGGPGASEIRGYDALGRMLSQRIDVGTTVYEASAITYNERGDIARVFRDDALLSETLVEYDYTEQGQLWRLRLGDEASTAQAVFDYDSRGNLESRSGLAFGPLFLSSYIAPGSFDQKNRIVASGWEYDDAGRLTADDAFLYSYNRAGRLASVTDRSGHLIAHYLYDADGLRVRKLTETSVTYYYRNLDGAVVAEATYDLDNLDTAISQKDYVTHNGENVMTAATGNKSGFEGTLSDRLGNPVVRWQGEDVKLQEYSPYGQQMHHDPESQHDGAYDFTGHEQDAETEQIYMRARYFDPEAARFTRPDPARDFRPLQPGSFNLYQYALNNPSNVVDPTGMFSEGDGPVTRQTVQVQRGVSVGKDGGPQASGSVAVQGQYDSGDNVYLGVSGEVGISLGAWELPVGVQVGKDKVAVEAKVKKDEISYEWSKEAANRDTSALTLELQHGPIKGKVTIFEYQAGKKPVVWDFERQKLTGTTKSYETSVKLKYEVGLGGPATPPIRLTYPEFSWDWIRTPD